MSEPILPLEVWQSGTNENSLPANENSLRQEALNRLVLSKSVTAQPVSPDDRDVYIIPSGATGSQWSTFDMDDIAIYVVPEDASPGTWLAWAPVDGLMVNVNGVLNEYSPSNGWSAVGGGGGGVQTIVAGTGITVDDTDPANPIVAATGSAGTLGQSINSPAVPISSSLSTYYLGDGTDQALASGTVTQNRMYYIPFTVPNIIAITALGINVQTLTASQKARVGIYSNAQASGRNRPNAQLVSTGDLSTGATGIVTGSASISLDPGVLYWLGIATSANPGTFLCTSGSNARFHMGRLGPANHNPIHYLYEALAGGWTVLPANANVSLTAGNGTYPVAATVF